MLEGEGRGTSGGGGTRVSGSAELLISGSTADRKKR